MKKLSNENEKKSADDEKKKKKKLELKIKKESIIQQGINNWEYDKLSLFQFIISPSLQQESYLLLLIFYFDLIKKHK